MKKLENDELKQLLGSGNSGGGGGLSCEAECIILPGEPTGCSQGQSCYNVTCEQDENQCQNRCF